MARYLDCKTYRRSLLQHDTIGAAGWLSDYAIPCSWDAIESALFDCYRQESDVTVNEFLHNARSKQIVWPLLVVTAIIISDQITKAYIVEWLKPQGTVSIVGDFLRLTFVTNSGVAFGMLTGIPYILTVPIVILVGVIIFYLVKTLGQSFLLTLALSLELGGALGNLIDRIRLGYVVDFVKFPYWPAFNVADSCVVVGAIGLAFILLWQDRETRTDNPESPPA